MVAAALGVVEADPAPGPRIGVRGRLFVEDSSGRHGDVVAWRGRGRPRTRSFVEDSSGRDGDVVAWRGGGRPRPRSFVEDSSGRHGGVVAWRGRGRPRTRSFVEDSSGRHGGVVAWAWSRPTPHQVLRRGLLRTTWWRRRLAWSRPTPPQVLRRGLLRTTWWRRRVVHGNRSCRPSRVPILSHHCANCMAAAGDGFPPPRERRVDGCFRRHPSCGRTRVPAEAQAPAMMSLSFWTFSCHHL